jgi:ribosomal protein S18 acetylase RimI-like enzyme
MPGIRPFAAADWPAVWAILEPVFRAGETYAVARDIGEDAARALWIDAPLAAFVATDAGGAVLGTCYLKPNHAGPGDHVANCGYAVAEAARGQGIASALCAHSQAEAVRLWQRHGFAIVGTLPGAFRHPRLGEVDACVMFKRLDA